MSYPLQKTPIDLTSTVYTQDKGPGFHIGLNTIVGTLISVKEKVHEPVTALLSLGPWTSPVCKPTKIYNVLTTHGEAPYELIFATKAEAIHHRYTL